MKYKPCKKKKKTNKKLSNIFKITINNYPKLTIQDITYTDENHDNMMMSGSVVCSTLEMRYVFSSLGPLPKVKFLK